MEQPQTLGLVSPREAFIATESGAHGKADSNPNTMTHIMVDSI